MHTHAARHSRPGATVHLPGWLRAVARRLSSWLARRDKLSDDDRVLEAMSARELRDIGLDPSRACSETADGWITTWRM